MLNTAEPTRDLVHLVTRAVKNDIVDLLGELLYGSINIKSEALCDRHKERAVPALLLDSLKAVYGNSALSERETSVGDKSVNSYSSHLAKTVAMRTRALRIVKGEHSRLKLAKRNIVLLAGVALRKFKLASFSLSSRHGNYKQMSVGNAESILNRV